MEINLRTAIEYNMKCLQNKTLLRNILMDKYPEKEVNIVLVVFESGILRDIATQKKNNQPLTEWIYRSYVQKLVDTHGLQEHLAIQGLNAWVNLFLGDGYSDRFMNTSENGPSDKPQKSVGNIDDYELTMLSDTTAEIKAYKGVNVEEIVVPNEISGIKIIGIGEEAYTGHTRIKRLIVSEGIRYIKDAAFFQCSYLEKVILPTSLIELGGRDKNSQLPMLGIVGSFGQCENLSEITLPNKVTKIGSGAFLGCKNLRSVKLNEGLAEIGQSAFKECENLSEITIPSTVTKMETRVFSGCKNLRFVKLNEGLTEITRNMFYQCESLSDIIMPSTVTIIGECAFKGCINLESVELNEGLTEIGEDAFEGCKEHLRIIKPSTVTNAYLSPVFTDYEERILPLKRMEERYDELRRMYLGL